MDNEIFIRLGIFFLAFAALAMLEQIIPRRSEEASKGSRWRTNWSFVIIDSFFLKLLALAIPLLAIGAAMDAKANSIGILNLFDWPIVIEFILSILILDFAIWLQHVVTHKIPFLWRCTKSTTLILNLMFPQLLDFTLLKLSFLCFLKLACIPARPSALAVLVFEILLNASAMFNHANINIPPKLKSFSDYSSLHQTCTEYTTPQIEVNTILTTGSHSLFGINYLAPIK